MTEKDRKNPKLNDRSPSLVGSVLQSMRTLTLAPELSLECVSLALSDVVVGAEETLLPLPESLELAGLWAPGPPDTRSTSSSWPMASVKDAALLLTVFSLVERERAHIRS